MSKILELLTRVIILINHIKYLYMYNITDINHLILKSKATQVITVKRSLEDGMTSTVLSRQAMTLLIVNCSRPNNCTYIYK